MWSRILRALPPDGFWVHRDASGAIKRVSGFTAPRVWVYTTLFATLAFGAVTGYLSDEFCFTCAGKAVPIVPLLLIGLMTPLGANYAVEFGHNEVIFRRRWLFFTWRKMKMSLSSRVLKGCSGPEDSGALILVDAEAGSLTGLFGARRTRPQVAKLLDEAIVSAGGKSGGWISSGNAGLPIPT